MTAPLLSVEALRVVRRGMTVLERIDLRVADGEAVAIIGANGAGKSTLLGAVAGLVPVTAGDIHWRGHSLASLPAHARARAGIGFSPEGRRPFPAMTVADNLLCATRAGRAERSRLLDRQFALFPELAQRRKALAWQLSGGEQQMLALARALMGEPSLLLLDEPFLGLAPGARDRLAAALAGLRAERPLALLIADQESTELTASADTVWHLRAGRLHPVDNSI